MTAEQLANNTIGRRFGLGPSPEGVTLAELMDDDLVRLRFWKLR